MLGSTQHIMTAAQAGTEDKGPVFFNRSKEVLNRTEGDYHRRRCVEYCLWSCLVCQLVRRVHTGARLVWYTGGSHGKIFASDVDTNRAAFYIFKRVLGDSGR